MNGRDFRVTSVRENQGESGNYNSPFSNQGKRTFLEKIREKSGSFIMNQGKKIKEFCNCIYLCLFYDFSIKKNRSRCGASILRISLNFWLAASALGY